MVKLLERGGVNAERLSAVGYGEHQPAASNDTAEGRAQNRRVALMIARARIERPSAQLPAQLESSVSDLVMDEGPAAGEALRTDGTQPEENAIEATELESGDLVFSSDPEPPRARSQEARLLLGYHGADM